MKLLKTLLLLTITPKVFTHDTDQSIELSWEKSHMKYEHDLDEYDALTFFNLHDLNNKGYMDSKDILSLYGLLREEIVGKGDGMGIHDDSEIISEELKNEIVLKILEILDSNSDEMITKEEYLKYSAKGGEFPDLGVGIGHSQDFEKEYEIHHWNKYHKNQDPDIKIIHKEDVEHELLHHEHNIESDIEKGKSFNTEEMISINNIPQKYFSS